MSETTNQTSAEAVDSIEAEVPAETPVPFPAANGKRLYINNVSYNTTEEDLAGLLSDYKVRSILIPSQTVRGFKSFHQKSLGIAYVDFESEEQAELAKEHINGKLLDNRALRVKNFIPYSPSAVKRSGSKVRGAGFLKRGSKLDPKAVSTTTEKISEEEAEPEDEGESGAIERSDNQDSAASITPLTEGEASPLSGDPSSGSVKESGSEGDVQSAKIEQPISDDTIYIGRLSAKVTDGDLREFFHAYGPTDVYIFKSRYKKNQRIFHHQRYVSALVTLGFENALSKALEELGDKKLKGKKVILKASYLSKIDEVKRAAEARQKKLDQIEKDELAKSDIAERESTSRLNEVVEGDDSLNVVQEDEDEEGTFEEREEVVLETEEIEA